MRTDADDTKTDTMPSTDLQARVQELVRTRGLLASAKLLGVNRATLERALGGRLVQRGSALQMGTVLDSLERAAFGEAVRADVELALHRPRRDEDGPLEALAEELARALAAKICQLPALETARATREARQGLALLVAAALMRQLGADPITTTSTKKEGLA